MLVSILAIVARPRPYYHGPLPVGPYDNRLALYYYHPGRAVIIRPSPIPIIRAGIIRPRRRVISWSTGHYYGGMGRGYAAR
jgi:hypothetical protein